MNKSLYEIDNDFLSALAECRQYAEEHDGEISEELDNNLNAIDLTRENKLENYVKYYKNELRLSEMLSNECDYLHERHKKHEANADWIKERLKQAIPVKEKKEYASGLVSWRKSEQTNIYDSTKLPECCVEKIEITKVIKANVKEEILKGNIPDEVAKIVEINNIIIK